MPYGNNALSKEIRKDKRKHFIEVAIRTKTVIDFLTFDLSSYFRVQYIVMFVLRGIPFNLREFLMAAYYLQVTGQQVYARQLYMICPHIKKTTIDNMLKYDLILADGEKQTGNRGRKAKTFVVHPYYFNIIERALKECAHTIRDTNSKRRKKEQSAKDAENVPTDSIDFGSIFDELE